MRSARLKSAVHVRIISPCSHHANALTRIQQTVKLRMRAVRSLPTTLAAQAVWRHGRGHQCREVSVREGRRNTTCIGVVIPPEIENQSEYIATNPELEGV